MTTKHRPWDEDYSQAWRDGFYAAQANQEPREDRPAWKHMLVVLSVGVLLNVGFYGGLYLLFSGVP
jgi:hypothetical protein